MFFFVFFFKKKTLYKDVKKHTVCCLNLIVYSTINNFAKKNYMSSAHFLCLLLVLEMVTLFHLTFPLSKFYNDGVLILIQRALPAMMQTVS